MQAAAQLKAAEDAVASGSKTKAELQGQIDSTKATYSGAHEKYLKEKAELDAAPWRQTSGS